MFYPDTETRRQLVREHQEGLRRDAMLASPTPRPQAVESRRLRRRLQLRRFRIRLRPADDLS